MTTSVFRMRFLSFSKSKYPKFFPQGLFFLCCSWNVYQNALIPRNLTCSHKFLVTHLYYMAYLPDTLRKNRLSKFFATALKHATCINFQFHNLKFKHKGILDFHVTTVGLCTKQVIESLFCRAFWRKILNTLKALILTIIVLNLVRKGLFF